MAEKISAVYKIVNTITNDFYIGSSKNIKRRWAEHKCPSTWNKHPNNPLYLDMKRYGLDYFEFEILTEVEAVSLKETEQKFIETLKPTYNNIRAKGLSIEEKKEYYKSDKRKEYMKEYEKSDKRKKYKKEYNNKYDNQLCRYNGEVLTLSALSSRFRRRGITHSAIEAKKYLVL